MKHLIKESESINFIKDLFKTKIDWNFYNYLLYKSTDLEDRGVDVSVNIFAICGRNSHRYIYNRINWNFYNYFQCSKETAQSIYEDYLKNGLCYMFEIGTDMSQAKYLEIFDNIIKNSNKYYKYIISDNIIKFTKK